MSSVQEYLAAAADGDWPLVEQLLEAQPLLLEAANEWGWTSLMQAARGGHVSLVASLISLGADVSVINKLGMDVLSVACATGNVRLVQLLKEHNGRGRLAASSAVVHGHPHLLAHLDLGLSETSEPSPISGASALHLAVAKECADGVQQLLGRGANPNQRDAARRTPLDVAGLMLPSADLVDITRMLAKVSDCKLSRSWAEGVEEAARIGDVRQLMVLLAEMNLKCMVREKSRHSHSQLFSQALLHAAENGKVLAIEVLLQQEVNVNIFGSSGMTPLMLAASNGHLEAAERLLLAGADCRLRSSVSGHTAFEVAALSEHAPPQLARLLAKHTIHNAEAAAAPTSPRLQWPLSPQPTHRLLQLPKSPHRPASLPGSPTLQRAEKCSTPSKIKNFFKQHF